MPTTLRHPALDRTSPVLTLAMAVAWVAGSAVSDLTDFSGTGYAALYLPVGIVVAMLLRWPRQWLALWAGTVLGNLGLALVLYREYLAPVLEATVNFAEAALVAVLLLRWGGATLERPRDALALAVGSLLGATIGASVGTLLLRGSIDHDLWETWRSWVVSDAMGIVFTAPLLLSLLRTRPRVRQLPALGALLLASALLGWMAVSLTDSVGESRSIFVVFLPWYGLLLVSLYAGVRLGLLGLGTTQLPAALAGFTAVPVTGFDDWLARQALATGLAVSLLAVVLAIRAELIRREASERLARNLFERSPAPTARLRAATATASHLRLVDANHALQDLLGVPLADLIDADLTRFAHPDDASTVEQLLAGSRSEVEVRLRPRHRSEDIDVRITAVAVTDDGAHGAEVMVVLRDVTGERRFEQQLLAQARTDSLTGALNRGAFTVALDDLLAQADSPVGVIFIDLDDFKDVNDRFGHAIGDQVLRQSAERIRRHLRPRDLLGRYGGDEFVAAVVVQDEAALEAIRLRMEQALADPVTADGVDVSSGGSAGADMTQPGDDADALLHRADQRMYARKAQRKGRG